MYNIIIIIQIHMNASICLEDPIPKDVIYIDTHEGNFTSGGSHTNTYNHNIGTSEGKHMSGRSHTNTYIYIIGTRESKNMSGGSHTNTYL